MKATILHKLNVEYPLKTVYQRLFIKHIIEQLERRGSGEIHDIIYEQLAEKLIDDDLEFSYKHFLLTDDDREAITIKESNSFIRDGTTGLKLWPAAMALSRFIVSNKSIFDGKAILELGSGATGFVGMVLLTTCSPRKVYLSDCHESVIDNLVENVKRNLAKYQFDSLESSLMVRQRVQIENGPEFGILNLPWEDVDKNEIELFDVCHPNILLASDVVYDDSIFGALIKCINRLFELSEPPMFFYLSQTVRNIATYEKFCDLLRDNHYEAHEQDLNHPTSFNWEKSTEIKILRISRRRLAQEP